MQMEPFTNHGTDDGPLYHPAHLSKLNLIPRSSVERYCKEMPQHFVVSSQILICKSNTKARMLVNLVTVDGMKYILRKTRRPIPEEILEHFKIKAENKFCSEEAKWLSAIKEAFSGTEIKEQYTIGKYRLDAYLPAYNIVIEVDEPSHKYYEFKHQMERTVSINFMLKNPTIIRINLLENVSIFKIINKVYKAIIA
jgi:very-short-patch-repair endonuclease